MLFFYPEQLHQIQELHKKLPANIELFLHDLEAEAKTLTEQLTNTVIRAAGNKTEDLKCMSEFLAYLI